MTNISLGAGKRGAVGGGAERQTQGVLLLPNPTFDPVGHLWLVTSSRMSCAPHLAALSSLLENLLAAALWLIPLPSTPAPENTQKIRGGAEMMIGVGDLEDLFQS